MTAWYRTNTVNVANGSPNVTGVLTTFLNQVKLGDLFIGPDLKSYEIAADPVSNTALVLTTNYTGATLTGQSYAIARFSASWRDTAEIAQRLGALVSRFEGSSGLVLKGTGVPSNAVGDNGDVYLREDVPELYFKAAGVWGSATSLGGPTGATGPGYKGTSITSLAISAGVKTLTTQAGLGYIAGSRVRIASNGGITNYMEGLVSSYTTGTGVLIFTPDRTGGSGTFADWNLTLAGDTGSVGPAGAASTAISSTSLLIATGSKAFTILAGLSFANGQRVRAASAANTANFMEGRCAYAGTVLTITVDVTGGAGTFNDWSIGPAGERGLQGFQGIQGIQGVQGLTGAGYAATSATSAAIGTGSKVFTTQAGLAYSAGSQVVIASDANPTTRNMRGTVTDYAGTVLTVDVAAVLGSGTYADWNINVHGERGVQGDVGPVGPPPTFATASVTSNTVSTGSKAFTVASGLGYGGGERVRIMSDSDLTKWMLAAVTDYTGTVLTVNVDGIGPGSGTATDWNIGLTGDRGEQGPAGGLGTLSTTKGNIPAADGSTFDVLPVGLDGTQPIADSTTPLGIRWDAIDNGICQGRLTLTTGVPVMTSTVSAATTIRFTPYLGATIALYNGTSWRAARFTETSLALTGFTAASNYDIFGYDNSGTLALEATIWTNSITRATALVMQDGVYVKSGTTTRRYLGTIRIDAVAGQCSWVYGTTAVGGGAGAFGLWNMNHRRLVGSFTANSTDNWNYTTAAWRAPNGSATMRTNFIVGLSEDAVYTQYQCAVSAGSGAGEVGIGIDSTTAFTGSTGAANDAVRNGNIAGTYSGILGAGFHYASAIENGNTSVIFYGDAGTGKDQYGLHFTGWF